jgi:hypothetical protein
MHYLQHQGQHKPLIAPPADDGQKQPGKGGTTHSPDGTHQLHCYNVILDASAQQLQHTRHSLQPQQQQPLGHCLRLGSTQQAQLPCLSSALPNCSTCLQAMKEHRYPHKALIPVNRGVSCDAFNCAGGWLLATAHIITAIIGAGVLGLPYAMSWLGELLLPTCSHMDAYPQAQQQASAAQLGPRLCAFSWAYSHHS